MQLDEVLAQQDFVEAEHVEKIMATEKVTNEKDIIIADLGAQVAYAYAREQEVDATHKQLAVHLACVEEEAAQAKEESWRRQKLLMTSSWRARPHAPLMLAHYWRVLDDPLEERLQSRTSGLLPWLKTMLPVINRSVHDARGQLDNGHQDIHLYFSQSARTRMATLSSNIRQYFPGIADGTTLTHRISTNNHVHELKISEPVAESYLPPVRVEPFLYWNRCDRT
jgi:hypothetical protein